MTRTSGRAIGVGTLVARAGVRDVEAAAEPLAWWGSDAEALAGLLSGCADPDLALDSLTRIRAALDDPDPDRADGAAFIGRLRADPDTARRLLVVLGSSQALGEHLARHPGHWLELADPDLATTRPTAQWLRERLLVAVGADPTSESPVSRPPDAQAVDALRVEYRRHLLRLAARDLSGEVELSDTSAELSDLAAAALEAALAVARRRVGPAADSVRLAVVAMGKCGGRELNYVSDVDVIFVHEPVNPDSDVGRLASQVAAQLMQVCSEQTAEGTLWPVDANLRPEGRSGPLSRTVASHQGYYQRWARTWEFQALLKARPVAGDLAVGRAWLDAVEPNVWQAAERDGFVEDVRAMRLRVAEQVPAAEADRELKLGPGGLRDIEFAVQLLQLVHGRADADLRSGSTLVALARLTAGGYVGRADGESLAGAYTFLRTLEHRLQLLHLRRTHVVGQDPESLRHLGRGLGLRPDPGEQVARMLREYRQVVRRLHEKIFHRPLLGAVAQLPGAEARLSLEAARVRMAALGYRDPAAALRHLTALTSGVSRTAAIQRTLLPVLLEWFARTPDPDAGLAGFRRVSDSLGRTPWYLRTLRDEGEVAQRLATILGSSRYATDLLEREPRGVQLLGQDLAPLAAGVVATEMDAHASRLPSAEKAVRAIRGVRRRELLRIAAGELTGVNDVEQVGRGLRELTDATLSATLAAVSDAVAREMGLAEPPTRMAVVAMGSYGGFELSYGSDADVVFVHDPRPGADPQQAATYARNVVGQLRKLLGAVGSDPPLEVDADLRPEGKQGPMVRTLESYAAYYARWSQVWERQALLRADAAVGDADLRRRFTELVDPLRYPAGGLSERDVLEVRRMKARVETERLPRGADPTTQLKLGRGGLADVEWTVQLLQLQHAGDVPELRTTRTLDALAAAVAAGLVADDDAQVLAESWRTVSRVRNAATLVLGRPSDRLPSHPTERAAVAVVLGYGAGESERFLDDHLRITRRAHAVVEKVFWGTD